MKRVSFVCYQKLSTLEFNFHYRLSSHCVHHTAHCAEKIVFACWCTGSASAKREGGWDHTQGAVYVEAARLGCHLQASVCMAAVRLGCKRVMVGTEWVNSAGCCVHGSCLAVTRMQGAAYMAAATLGCKRAMVGTEWANSHPGCMNRHRKRLSHIYGGFISGREGCL